MLTVYTAKDSAQWDSVAKSFSDSDVYYLSGYVKGFEIHGDGEPLLFYYEGDGIRGINVVMKRDISQAPQFSGKLPSGVYFDFATPYGYGGWIIEGDGDDAPLFEAYSKWCAENNIVSEFVRFHPVIENHKRCLNYCEVIQLSNTVCMDLDSPDVIWANITSKNRNMIRKAKNHSLSVSTGLSQELFDEFKEIYNATMDKDNATSYYYFGDSFYTSILEDLKDNALIFYVTAENGDVAAASIMLYENGKMNYHLSGSRREYQRLAPTNLLLHEAAVWGSEHGLKTLHLGGGVGSAEDGLLAFKKSFYRGDLRTFFIGKKIHNEEVYNELLKKRGEEIQSNYFPKYRA
ncbi:MAG: peptidoglycan bridge formation glycyltransferase FemA/FemB family protein [Clostridia bacterium]|nr:peptidoglycan bridge formation glycyltransferase FemA/FemB family protein [Clostridia bacterium]